MGNNTNVENEYGADQIQVLEGLEAVILEVLVQEDYITWFMKLLIMQ